jgi:predicted RNA-binding Zn-ribbon protein involved in translation (DUF1610 family)
MRRGATLVLALLVLQGGTAWAGEMVKIVCANSQCGYSQDLAIGGARLAPSLTGYCGKCNNFVRVKLASWKQYRDPGHKCSQCRSEIAPIYDRGQIANFPCPQCGQKTLQAKGGVRFD